jgi:amidase
MTHIPVGPLVYEFSRHNEPRATVSPGEWFTVDSEDAFSGQIRTNDDRRDKTKVPKSNPLTGPIRIEGAQPGDSLAVTIASIEPTLGQCVTRTGQAGMLSEWLGSDCPHGVHVCPIRDRFIEWSPDVKIPYQPMLGCLGTAPEWGVPTTMPSGNHGGNLDIIEVAPGNTIHLPVYVPGGFLYLGDAHAAMGHGELSASGLEMPAQTKLKVDVMKGKTIPGPRIETPDELIAIATGAPTERAIAEASSRLILWLEADYGLNRWLGYDLLTHVARYSVGWFAMGTIGVKIAKQFIPKR